MKFSTRIVSNLNSIDRRDWERLDHADNPFLSHAFLGGLESSGSIQPQMGWRPHHLALYEDGKLAAFAPSYIKANSHGEFVFDWAWADAYRRHRLPYYRLSQTLWHPRFLQSSWHLPHRYPYPKNRRKPEIPQV